MSVFEDIAELIISKVSKRWGVVDEDELVDTAKEKFNEMLFEDEPENKKKNTRRLRKIKRKKVVTDTEPVKEEKAEEEFIKVEGVQEEKQEEVQEDVLQQEGNDSGSN